MAYDPEVLSSTLKELGSLFGGVAAGGAAVFAWRRRRKVEVAETDEVIGSIGGWQRIAAQEGKRADAANGRADVAEQRCDRLLEQARTDYESFMKERKTERLEIERLAMALHTLTLKVDAVMIENEALRGQVADLTLRLDRRNSGVAFLTPVEKKT